MIRVNIYNEGRVPFIPVMCPVKDYPIADGTYQLLRKTPGIHMEPTKLALQREIQESKLKAQQESMKSKEEPVEEKKEKKAEIVFEDVPQKEKSPFPAFNKDKLMSVREFEEKRLQEVMNGTTPETYFNDEPAYPEEEASLEENSLPENTAEVDEIDAAIDSMEFSDEETNFEVKIPTETKIKKYTARTLEGKTKAEMKEILLSRGHNDGPFCPRYHDTVEKLRKKILDSQK